MFGISNICYFFIQFIFYVFDFILFLFVCLFTFVKTFPTVFLLRLGIKSPQKMYIGKQHSFIHLFLYWPFLCFPPHYQCFQCPPLEGAKHSFVYHVFYFCSSWGFQFRGCIPSRRKLKLLFNKLSSKLSFLGVNWKIFWWKNAASSTRI